MWFWDICRLATRTEVYILFEWSSQICANFNLSFILCLIQNFLTLVTSTCFYPVHLMKQLIWNQNLIKTRSFLILKSWSKVSLSGEFPQGNLVDYGTGAASKYSLTCHLSTVILVGTTVVYSRMGLSHDVIPLLYVSLC